MMIPCFKCGYVPESVDKEHWPEQPYGATTFTSGGHYGSTVYDPMSPDRYLRINICDKCLLEHKAQVQEVFVTRRSSVYDYQPWNPGPYRDVDFSEDDESEEPCGSSPEGATATAASK